MHMPCLCVLLYILVLQCVMGVIFLFVIKKEQKGLCTFVCFCFTLQRKMLKENNVLRGPIGKFSITRKMNFMKRILFMTILLAGLSSCSSVDSLLNQYEKACQNKDYEKMVKIADKLESKELTSAQEMRLAEISSDCMGDFDF